jgi:hypothetical protein
MHYTMAAPRGKKASQRIAGGKVHVTGGRREGNAWLSRGPRGNESEK